MMTRYQVWLNGQGLHDIADSVYITDIKEKTPKMRAITSEKPRGAGTRLLRMARESLSVTIRFAIREYDTARRKEVCNYIREWAQDGYLNTSDRPGQRLYVVCEKIPTVDSALKWASEMEMTFTAYDCPWWENETPTKATYTGKDGSVTLWNVGHTESMLEASITAAATVNSVTISVGSKTFTFVDLNLPAGSEMNISYDHTGVLSIKNGENSLLNKRTAESADDLTIKSGSNTVCFTADADCTAVFLTRGRFL